MVLGLLVALAGVTVSVALEEPPPGATGVPHPEIPAMPVEGSVR